MAVAMKINVKGICGANQLYAGVKVGIKAAVHAMRDLFEANETEGLLLIYASNAFNVLRRPAALWN